MSNLLEFKVNMSIFLAKSRSSRWKNKRCTSTEAGFNREIIINAFHFMALNLKMSLLTRLFNICFERILSFVYTYSCTIELTPAYGGRSHSRTNLSGQFSLELCDRFQSTGNYTFL